MHFLLRYFGTVAAVILTIYLVPGVTVNGGWSTTEGLLSIFLVALVWSVITMVIRPVLQILTFPFTIITFGLFAFVLNAFLFWAMTFIVPGFHVADFFAALLGAIVLSLISWFVHKIL